MKNQPNQTSEVQINLSKFEELAKSFLKETERFDELYATSHTENSELALRKFKEFIFSAQLNQQKRKEEYFKLKEQLESMKAEFEPWLDKEDAVVYRDCDGEYVAVKEDAYQNCDGCAFTNKSCGAVIDFYSCGEHKIIWKTK